MTHRRFGSTVFLTLAVSGLALTCCSVAMANPLPTGYLDFPVAPSEFVSQVSMPRVADDFQPGSTPLRIGYVEWWGSLSAGPWQLTLYSNADSDPTSPDEGGSSVIVEPFIVENWGGDLFHYAANVRGADWRLTNRDLHWLSVASFEPGWTWALGDGQPEFGWQREFAVESLAPDVWSSLEPPAQLAFGVSAIGMSEPGTFVLMVIGLLGLGLSQRRLGARNSWVASVDPTPTVTGPALESCCWRNTTNARGQRAIDSRR